MKIRLVLALAFVVMACSAHPQAIMRGQNFNPHYPVTPPAGATTISGIEQQSGWSGDSTYSVSGAVAPDICEISPTGNGNPCPGAGTSAGGTYSGGGGGSTMTLTTQGVSGQYSGWMAKKTVSTSGQLNMLLNAGITITTTGIGSGAPGAIQAVEVGRRYTNAAGVTDNGQTQFVPIYPGYTQLEFDIVPSSSGGWQDTGCRFPMFTSGTNNVVSILYVNDPNGALSVKYVSLNGTVCVIPSSLQHIAGSSMSWTPSEFVAAFQPDANKTGGTYVMQVSLSATLW